MCVCDAVACGCVGCWCPHRRAAVSLGWKRVYFAVVGHVGVCAWWGV